MSEPLAETPSQLLMFSAADFPVSRIRPLVDDWAPPMTATSGPSTPDSFASLDPDGSWQKTSQGCCQLTLDGSLEVFSETWPRAGMTRNGIAYQRPPLAPLTDATASGSWPTPTAQAAPDLVGLHSFNGTYYRKADGRKHQTDLFLAVKGRWPTPTVQDASNNAGPSQFKRNSLPLNAAVAQWATPTSNEYKVGRSSTNGRQLTREVFDAEGFSRDTSLPMPGSLNPTWVEWLMGYPLGWTDCGASATQSSRRSPNGSAGASSRRKGADA